MLPKFQQGFLVDIDKVIPKFIWKGKRPQVAKNNFEKNLSERNHYRFQNLRSFRNQHCVVVWKYRESTQT